MLVDFLVGTGISKEAVFCSSLPGNDVRERISVEVKSALKSSAVNIAILSRDYYRSAYCLNEAGVLWYEEDISVIPIALPEINESNMCGFLNSDYKLIRLDSDTDVSSIYDTVAKAISPPPARARAITNENNRLRSRYTEYLKARELPTTDRYDPFVPVPATRITTDDERVVLYYMLQKNIRKVPKSTVSNWLHDLEIRNVNVDNAFDLLSSIDDGAVNDDTLKLDINAFRYYSENATKILPLLKKYVDQHIELAVNTFNKIWDDVALDNRIRLFVAYIVDQQKCSFDDEWQIEQIQQWESKNTLDSTLSSNYGSCLEFFVEKGLVYASSWTSDGNTQEYTLYPSLQKFLFNCPHDLKEELQKVKNTHYWDLPF